jgi:hypothetical protein
MLKFKELKGRKCIVKADNLLQRSSLAAFHRIVDRQKL